METKKIENLIILDESGSMGAIREQAVSAMNETIQAIRNAKKQNPEDEYSVTIVVFEGNGPKGVRTLRERVSIDEINDLKLEEFVPGGCTPLYDAMGLSINELKKHTSEEDTVLVTVITDGMENASQEFSGRAIKELVGKHRELGWTFAYIGANQDAVEVANELNIRNALNFQASREGTRKMSRMLGESTLNFCMRNEPRRDADDFFKNLDDDKK